MTVYVSATERYFTPRRKQGKDAKKEAISDSCAFGLFAPWRETDAFLLVTVAGAGGEFARVFSAAAWALVRGTAARCGVWTTALVAHLGR